MPQPGGVWSRWWSGMMVVSSRAIRPITSHRSGAGGRRSVGRCAPCVVASWTLAAVPGASLSICRTVAWTWSGSTSLRLRFGSLDNAVRWTRASARSTRRSRQGSGSTRSSCSGTTSVCWAASSRGDGYSGSSCGSRARRDESRGLGREGGCVLEWSGDGRCVRA
jgi:hypothetical protein